MLDMRKHIAKDGWEEKRGPLSLSGKQLELELNREERNVLIAHQFVTGAVAAGSEDLAEVSVGGVEHVSASVFEPFDYVALGHIHRAQSAGAERIHRRYEAAGQCPDKDISGG